MLYFFFSSRRRHTRLTCDWSSDVCSSDLGYRLPQYEQCECWTSSVRCQACGLNVGPPPAAGPRSWTFVPSGGGRNVQDSPEGGPRSQSSTAYRVTFSRRGGSYQRTDTQYEEFVMASGMRTIIFPVTDLAQAKTLFHT